MKLLSLFILLLAFFSQTFAWSETEFRASKVHETANKFGPTNVTQHIGYVDINGTKPDSIHFFYWMFESQQKPLRDPLVMWLTGGPGCSSELALFFENGPFQVESDGTTLKTNPYSWNTFSNLLYIDNPVGTGFSWSDYSDDYVRNEQQVADDLYNFLLNFFAKYPEYAHLDFFLAGESYAGHYLPAISARIVRGNKEGKNPKINLHGTAIGNGWVDPYIQYGQYAPFSLDNKLIGSLTYDALVPLYETCKLAIDSGFYDIAFVDCSLILETILAENPGMNVYDIRGKCTYPPLCYNFDPVIKFMNLPSTKQALGVGNRDWSTCDATVHMYLIGDWVKNLAVDVPLLLAEPNYTVLVYSGQDDFICNWYGGREWCRNLNWPGRGGFNKAPVVPWTVNGKQAGVLQQYQGFKFLGVAQSGHMVPHDQPENALAMLKQFFNNNW